MQCPPQGADSGRDGREEIDRAGAHHADCRSAAVLAVVGVQDQQQVQRDHEIGVHLVPFAGHREHHVQEVLAVGEVILRVDERLANRLLVAEGGNGGHLGQHLPDGQLHLFGVAGVQRVFAVDGQGADHRAEDRHGMGVGRESGEDRAHPFVQQRVAAHIRSKLFKLVRGG